MSSMFAPLFHCPQTASQSHQSNNTVQQLDNNQSSDDSHCSNITTTTLCQVSSASGGPFKAVQH